MQSTNDILSNYPKKQNKSDIIDTKKDDNNSKHTIDNIWGSSTVSEVSTSDYLSSTDSDVEKTKKNEKKKDSDNLNNKNNTSKSKRKNNNHSSDISENLGESDNEIIVKKKLNEDKIKQIKEEYPNLSKKKKIINNKNTFESHEKKFKKNIFSDDSDDITTNEFEVPKRRGRPRKKKSEKDKIKSYSQTYSSYTSSDDDISSTHYNTHKKSKNTSYIHQMATTNRYHQNKKQEKMLYFGDGKKRKHIPLSQINVSDRSGRTPIFKFAKGDINACQALINAGADLNIKDNAGWTPLHEACLEGQLDIVKLLIRYGADVNACAQNLDTPLHDASENEHIEVVEYLLSNGAVLNAKNDKGHTPIDVVRDDSEVKEVLIKWDNMLKKIMKVDNTGQTVLHYAAADGDLEGLREYLRYGANVNVKDYAGWTPLHEACLSGHYKCAEELLLHGADLNTPGPDGDYPLHEASFNGHEKVIELLLSFGANPDQINEQTKKTPKALARNSNCSKLLNENLSKYKPFKKSKFSIAYLPQFDGSGNIEYNNSVTRIPGHDINIMYSASSDTSHTITTYQYGAGTWTNASGGIKLPESMKSVSIDGGNNFSSSRDERKFRALLHQIDEFDKKEKKRKHENEHHENIKTKKKLKSLTSNKDNNNKEKLRMNDDEKQKEKLHKVSLKELKINSDDEETVKPIKKKKEKSGKYENVNAKKDFEKFELESQKLKEKDKEKEKENENEKISQERYKITKNKYKSSIDINNPVSTEMKIRKNLKEKNKDIDININDKNVKSNDNINKENENDNKNDDNKKDNSKYDDKDNNKHDISNSSNNNIELDEEETIDVVETATPTYNEEPIIDNDDLLLSSDLGLMYTRQRSTRRNINYDLTSETSTPQLSPTAQHSIGDYDMSWAEDMSFLKTIKEDKTDGDWLDTSKKSSTSSRRKKRTHNSRLNDIEEKEKTKSNDISGNKKAKSEKLIKSGETSVKRRRLVSGNGHAISEIPSSYHSNYTKSEKNEFENTITKMHKSKKDKEKLKEKIKEKEKEFEDKEEEKEKKKEKVKEKNDEKDDEKEKENEKEKEKEKKEKDKNKEKDNDKEKEKEKEKEFSKQVTNKKKSKKWNFLGISGYQRVNNSSHESLNVLDKSNINDNIKKEKEVDSINDTLKSVKVEDSLSTIAENNNINKEDISKINKSEIQNSNKHENIKTKEYSSKIANSDPGEDKIEIKATIIPVNDEITKLKYKTYSEENYIDPIKPEISELENNNLSPSVEKKENKSSELKRLSKQNIYKNNDNNNDDDNDNNDNDNDRKMKSFMKKSKKDDASISFNNDDLLRTPSPKIEKKMDMSISSYSNSPSSVSTPSILPLLDIENMSSKFRAEDIRERKLIKSIITNYRKCRCLPLYAFKLPAKENYIANILLASQDQKIASSKKKNNDDDNTTRYVTDIQIGLFLGYKSGRELLDKFPTLKKRVATLAEKERLENSPISELIVNCLLTIPETKKWNKFDKQLKLTDLDIQFLKLDEVMNMVIKQEHFDKILNDEIEEVSLKVSKTASERFKSLQHINYLESSPNHKHSSSSSSNLHNNNNNNTYPFNIKNKMMLLTIDVDLLSFPRETSFMNKSKNPIAHNYSTFYHHNLNTNSNNNNNNNYRNTYINTNTDNDTNSNGNSETTTPNGYNKFNKNDTPYRNGFKKSFLKYQQQLSSLNSNSNSNSSTPDYSLKPLQTTYQKSSNKIIHHLPIQMNKPPIEANLTNNYSSPTHGSSSYNVNDTVINPSSKIVSSNSEMETSSPSNNNPTFNKYIRKIEKINKSLPLKAKFKLATKENF